MEVTFKMTPHDLLHSYYFMAERRKQNPSRTVISMIFLCALNIWGLAGLLLTKEENTLQLVPIITCFAGIGFSSRLAWLYSGVQLNRQLKAQLGLIPHILLPHRLSIGPQFLDVDAEYMNLRVRWQAVKEVVADKDYLYIGMESTAYPVARHFFSTPAEAERFFEAARSYWQNAKTCPLAGEEGVWPPAPRTLG